MLLPVLGPARGRWPRSLAGPPAPGGGHEQDPGWPKSMESRWGEPGPGDFIIRAVGIIPVGTTIPPGDEHTDFDHTAAQWTYLLRDWLAVAAEGPTDFPDRDYHGATIFGSPEYDDDELVIDDEVVVAYRRPHVGHRHRPLPLSAWAWSHALWHASRGDQPPLERSMMTTAIRAAAIANWRAAIIDAATAVEVALTGGLSAELSAETSPRVIEKLLDATRTLGRRLDLAKKLGMPPPAKIRKDLVEHRNAVVHQGVLMTSADAEAAISVAWAATVP